MNLHIRWMIRRDMPAVLGIEARSFGSNWTEEDYLRILRQRSTFGMVVEKGTEPEDVVAFTVYRLHRAYIEVERLAVDPEHRRAGAGRMMVAKLKGKLSPTRRRLLAITAREGNDPAHRFLASQGLRATVLRDAFEHPSEDGYLFTWYHPDAPGCGTPGGVQSAINREIGE